MTTFMQHTTHDLHELVSMQQHSSVKEYCINMYYVFAVDYM